MENRDLEQRSYLLGYVDGIGKVPSKVKETCKWSAPDGSYDIYNSECGTTLMLSQSEDIGGEFKFCPFCGKEIEEIKE